MKKIIIIFIVIIISVASGAFYAGMKYQQSKGLSFQNTMLEQRQQFGERGAQRRTGEAFISGEVFERDENSLTLKMPDGTSAIVFFSDSVEILKMAEGEIGDIETGKQITITGEQNSEGVYTAKTIQLSPRVFRAPN